MQKLILGAVAALLLCSAAAASTYENPSVVGQVPDRVVITVAAGTELALDKSGDVPRTGLPGLDAVAATHGVTDIAPLYGEMPARLKNKADADELSRVYAVDFPASAGLKTVLADYARLPEVAEARAVDICKLYGNAYLPNDINNQYYLRNTSLGGADIRALGGWAESLGDSNVIVAVIDSGVDWNHPDLGGPHPDKVNGAIWTNWDEYYGSPGVDDDGNGYVDDIRGWDFVDLPPGSGYPDEDVEDQDNDPSDYESHGTNCAGVVAPLTDNGIGIAGTAPGCKIMALRVGWLPNGESQGVVRMDFAAQGIVYATVNGAKILNASWGSSAFLGSAVRTALNAGCLIFTAAGNDNTQDASYLNGYPDGSGSDTRVLGVAATNSNDAKAGFSNYGTWVDLSAPGTGIYTTAYSRFTGESTYGTTQGTSFASPLAAGAAALLWSANPGLTNSEISQLLRDSCDDLDAVNPGYEGLLGAGRVNLLKALGDDVQQVPGEFFELSDALNSAATGDTIKVLASEVLGPTTLLGKELQILGGYAPDYVSRDPLGTPTLIEGTTGGPALQFTGTVTTATVVDGFRIQGGGGRTFANIPYAGTYGGGVMINGTSPTLRNLVVTGNTVGGSSELGIGGGLALHNSEAVLENIEVTGNSAIYGAGVFIHRGTPQLTDVVIEDNTVFLDNFNEPAIGGGLHIVDSAPVLQNVDVRGHLGARSGGGVWISDVNETASVTWTGGEISGNSAEQFGGGLAISGGDHQLQDLTITGNVQTAEATFMRGGGLYATEATIGVDGATLTGNSAQAGGGLFFDSCVDVGVSGTVVAQNEVLLFGGALNVSGTPAATVSGVTVAANDCPAGGSGLYLTSSTVTVENIISAFNTGGTATANGVFVSGGSVTVACSDVFGNDGDQYGGIADPTGTDGNISADPQFCDLAGGDFAIAESSPCAPAQSGGCGLIGALEAGCGTNTPVEDPQVPVAFRVDQAYPNPFNPITNIRFALPSAAHTTLVIYDVKGRVVRTLLDEQLAAATHTIQWRGQDDTGRNVAAGIYFYRVTSGDHTATGRMALIK
jgi:subtilisin family serine protease